MVKKPTKQAIPNKGNTMASTQSDALLILRVMADELDMAIGQTLDGDELAIAARLNRDSFDKAIKYLIDHRYIKPRISKVGEFALTAAGLDFVEREQSKRIKIGLIGERILQELVASPRPHLGQDDFTIKLDLTTDDYNKTCRLLEDYGLIQPVVQEGPWAVIRATNEGRKAVNEDFQRTPVPSQVVFDQRGQTVTYQYNANGDINIDAVQNNIELISQLELLKAELRRAGEAKVVEAEIVDDAEHQVSKAITQAKKPGANKQTVLGHLQEAKALLDGTTSAAGLISALAKAAGMVQQLF